MANFTALPNAPRFLIQVDDHFPRGERMAREFATQLNDAGTPATVELVPQMAGHIADYVGAVDNVATRGLKSFLEDALAR